MSELLSLDVLAVGASASSRVSFLTFLFFDGEGVCGTVVYCGGRCRRHTVKRPLDAKTDVCNDGASSNARHATGT